MAGFRIVASDELEFGPPSAGDQRRGIVRLSDSLTQMRANVWRMPPGTRGRRHRETVQEELFVVLEGTATLRLGEPPEAVALSRGSLAIVEPGTAVQLLNDGVESATVLIVGAPPAEGKAEYLSD